MRPLPDGAVGVKRPPKVSEGKDTTLPALPQCPELRGYLSAVEFLDPGGYPAGEKPAIHNR